jgi:hypothetical protein
MGSATCEPVCSPTQRPDCCIRGNCVGNISQAGGRESWEPGAQMGSATVRTSLFQTNWPHCCIRGNCVGNLSQAGRRAASGEHRREALPSDPVSSKTNWPHCCIRGNCVGNLSQAGGRESCEPGAQMGSAAVRSSLFRNTEA